MKDLEQWLAPLDAKLLECDGMTRVISALLQRESIEHRIHIGSLSIPDVGVIPHHWWIELQGGEICDFRARMWLRNPEQVPHGVFMAQPTHEYVASATLDPEDINGGSLMFHILTGEPLEDFPSRTGQQLQIHPKSPSM